MNHTIYRDPISDIKLHQWTPSFRDAATVEHVNGEIIGDIYITGHIFYDARRQGVSVDGDTIEEVREKALAQINGLREEHWDCYADDSKWCLCYR